MRIIQKGLLLYFKNTSTDPKSILSLFPKRGPGSGESRYLITKFLDSNYSQLDNFDDELQDLIDQTWRSILVNLIEMHHLNRNEKPVSILEIEPDSCEYEYCNSPHIMETFDSKGKLVARSCISCGAEQQAFDEHPGTGGLRLIRCKGFDSDNDDPGQVIRCIERTTDESGYCSTHRPKNL